MPEPTHDPLADAGAVFDTVVAGGVAIFKADVGYAIVGHAPGAIARIYEAKARSFDKPCGMFASVTMFDEVIEIDRRGRDLVQLVVVEHDLPLSIVAPFRPDHPLFARPDPFVLRNATRSGTVDLLLNAGPTHDEIARLSLESGIAVFGSSANRSLTGSKFTFADIEPEVVAAADLALDRGACRYRNPHGLGSTIIDLRSFTPVRMGILFDEIRGLAGRELGIDIPARLAV